MKNQLNKDKLTFEMSSSGDEIEGWSLDIKQALFKFLQNYGMPLNTEGRTNWVEFKEKFLKATSVDPQEMNRSVAQIEKMVQKIRMKCQQIITNEKEGEMVNEEGTMNEENSILFAYIFLYLVVDVLNLIYIFSILKIVNFIMFINILSYYEFP